MPPDITQAFSGFRSLAHGRASRKREPITLVDGGDGYWRHEGDKGRIILSTDDAIKEGGFWGPRRYLSLRHTKKMLSDWQESGALNLDGSLPMFMAHSQRSEDKVGRWENLAIENRGTGDKAFKALVGSPAFAAEHSAAWAKRKMIERWQTPFEDGTHNRASIGFEVNGARTRQDEAIDGIDAFTAHEWHGKEASWVSLGADMKAEQGRSGVDNMDPEDLKAFGADIATTTATAAVEAMRVASEADTDTRKAPGTGPVDLSPAVAADAAQWASLRKLAARGASGDDLLALLDRAEASTDRCATLADALAERDTTPGHGLNDGQRPLSNARISGGAQPSFAALRDFSDVMRARALSAYDQTNIADTTHDAVERARKVDQRWESATPRAMLLEFGRAHGILAPGYQYIDDPTLYRNMTSRPWGTPEQLFRHEGFTFMQVSDDVVKDRNGNILVEASIQARSSGLVPGDVPALFLAAPRITFIDILDAERLPIDQLTVPFVHDNFEKHTTMRRDIGVPFLKVEGGGQRLPFAQVWGERHEREAFIRGFQFKLDFEAMMRDGGAEMMALATQLPSAWADRFSLFLVDTLLAGQFRRLLSDDLATVYIGDYANSNRPFRPLFQHVQDVTAKSDPVPRPTRVDTNIDRRVHTSPNLPDRMLVGYPLDADIADYFAGKQPSGLRPGARNDEAALFAYEMRLRDGLIVTQAIQNRKMVLFKASGPHASVRRVILQGMQNIWRMISASQNASMGMGQLPTMDVEYISGDDLQMNSSVSTFENTLPV